MNGFLSVRRFAVLTLWMLVAVCPWTPSLAAESQQIVLGSDGTVFRLYEGTYGDLFPEGAEAQTENSVLALEVLRSEGVVERWLVPGTESADPDGSSSIVFEKNLGVYVLWEALFNGLHPQLKLTSFDGAQWSEVIEIDGGPFRFKGSPQLLVTRESSRHLDVPDRTILHLTWWEESAGAALKRYAPIFIQGGSYIGWSPVIELADFLAAGEGELLPEVPGLERALSLRPGKNDHTVVAGFLNPQTHRLSAVEIEVLPTALGRMADKARAHIVILGSSAKSHEELAKGLGEKMVELGSEFHEATLTYMMDRVTSVVAAAPETLTPEGIESIADKARAHIVILGSQFGSDGLVNVGDPQILEIGQSPSGGGPYQYVKVSVASDREAPEVGGPAELMLSESGQSMIVSWEEEDRVHYLESTSEGWSEPIVIELTEELDRETAYRMLAERVRAD